MSDALTDAIERLKLGGMAVPPAYERSLRKQFAYYGAAIDDKTREELIQKLLAGLKSVIHPIQEFRDRGLAQGTTVGETPNSLNADITRILTQFEGGRAIAAELNLPFKLDVAQRVMRGAGHFLTDQTDIDEYPAWEFHRLYERDVPRGYKRTGKGVIEVPEENWPTRLAEAGEQCGDDNWLEWEGDDQAGRGVALKSSGIWQALGDGAGGYDDTLGNPFYPFAFNSGFGTDGVPYNECVQLGLIEDGDRPEPAKVDFAKLFEIPA